MAASQPVRIEISFEALKEALDTLRDLYALAVADLAIYKAVANELAARITHLEAEVARLTSTDG